MSRQVFWVSLILCTIASSAPQDHETKPPPAGEGTSRTQKGGSPTGENEGCGVDPDQLVSVANGESQAIAPVVLYLTNPACVSNRLPIARAVMSRGVQFNQMPFRLDQFVKNYSLNSLQSVKKMDAMLRRIVPPIMEDHPMSVQEQIPLVAQFSLLSQATGTWALGNLIKEELVANAPPLNATNKREGPPEELAKSLLAMGVTENVVVNELVGMVEDMALLSQADALGKVLKGLASAASVEGALVPVFNAAAGAFQRGVEKGKKNYNNEQVRNLALAGIEGTKEAIQGNSLLNVGISDLNEAFKALLEGKTIESISLKVLWKEIVKALALTPLLPNLAEMIATSLTSQVVFLQERERKLMVAASSNYPSLVLALEKSILAAWTHEWDALHAGNLSIDEFNSRRERFFKPLVNEMLENDSVRLDDVWIHSALRRGLIRDDLIEKRFPSFVLNLYERRENSLSKLFGEPELEEGIATFTENFSVLWSLAYVYIPALRKWVLKYDE